MRLSGKFYLDWIAQVYIYVFRGTPILVQIFIIYYGLPQFEAVTGECLLEYSARTHGLRDPRAHASHGRLRVRDLCAAAC